MTYGHRRYIKCKYMDCVEVCPVDCFYEGRISSSSIRTVHRLRRLRTGMPGGSDQARYRAGLEKWLGINADFASEMAEHHASASRRRAKEWDSKAGQNLLSPGTRWGD